MCALSRRVRVYAHAGFEDEMIGLGHLPAHSESASVSAIDPISRLHAHTHTHSLFSYIRISKNIITVPHTPALSPTLECTQERGVAGPRPKYSVVEYRKNKRIGNGAKGGQSAAGLLVSREVLPRFCATLVICIISYSECIYAPEKQKRLNPYSLLFSGHGSSPKEPWKDRGLRKESSGSEGSPAALSTSR